MGNSNSASKRQLTPGEKNALRIIQQEIIKGIVVAKKQSLVYKTKDFSKFTPEKQKEIIDSMRKDNTTGGIYNDKLFPKQSILINLDKPDLVFNTFFKNMFEKEYEEKNVPFQPGYALIKGPLGEVYQVSNIDLAKKYNQQGDVFISKSEETCKFVKITGNLFDIMKKSKQFVEIDDETLQMETSYDQLNTVKKGDYVRIDNDNFYRVKPEAFKLTYEVLPFNNILKINAKNIMA